MAPVHLIVEKSTPMFRARCIRSRLPLLLAMGVFAAMGRGRAAPVLMPQPMDYHQRGGTLALTGGMKVEWQGAHPTVLDRAVVRFAARLTALSGWNAVPDGRPGLILRITCRSPDPDWLTIHMREHYQLRTGPQGVTLVADGPAGVLRGLSTLLQLVEPRDTGAVLSGAVVDDSPRFAWRGLLVDVSRHFMSVTALERQMDMMELTKLNVLHLHLSDGQGFRVESRLFPRLQQVAGAGGYYTRQQVRALVGYAADRGIRIVPEFDAPGHSYALLRAYPQYAAQPVTSPMDPRRVVRAALDPSNPQTYVFLAQLYHEMAGLFPDAYFHVGGDEVRPDEWTANPKISAFMKQHGYADAPALQAAFTQRIQAMLAQAGKVMMGWDELIQAPVPASIVIEPWRGSRYTAQATAAGHPVVVSAGYYLDLLLPAQEYYRVDPLDPQGNGLPPDQVAQAHASFLDAFALDPTARMTPAQDRRVMGAEAALWTEIVTEDMLDSRLWPRSAALAERFWSPASVPDADSLAMRLPVVQAELEKLGNHATLDRQRMMDRLAPHGTAPLATLLSVVSPVRNYALNHVFGPGRIPPTEAPQPLDRVADIATPDSFAAAAFMRDVRAYLAGRRDLAATLRVRLELWRDNDGRLRQAARVDTALDEALPASALLAQLAQAGLDALENAHTGWQPRARDVLATARAQFAASQSILAVRTMPQPAGDLLQAVTPGIAALVAAARPGG
ncbi:beta-N-acetylhexosaminidase [Komagataeibacter rhaeticus]|uniref:beta-N-acetylhexosaminidase n=1 Tax=Komagataeibacter rhaeticus TaxID=215221 RepID=UPI0009FCF7F7|nr:family 20 glycosylhydrolase [Komagataeibacter rhaeticus]MBL7239518.1 family 20 glycosylhydrolase [Komagataeibacter rhaeticus]PYD53510.1 beta-N-acetylhexosaminidase [Komagataeibacter rhaeticus]